MLAYVLQRYGRPDGSSLMEVPAPKPGSRQLLVRVRAAGLNPLDFKTRMGDVRLRLFQPYRRPVVLGNELAGELIACGDQVQRFRAGDRVFARVDKDRMGAFAQFAVVEEDHAAAIPASLDFANAAAVPLAGLTALQALRDELYVASGQRIFISGGAGGVGSFAIQIAKHLGAQVATTASPRGEALVRQLGADMVVDYTQERPASVLSGFDGALTCRNRAGVADSAFGHDMIRASVIRSGSAPQPWDQCCCAG
jgi:NADPH:quinone reductase-like Zn-dependent oxidoreductase